VLPFHPPSILSRLRLETRSEHDAAEKLLDLMGCSLTHDRYRQRLEQFYGFYAPLERALLTRCDSQLERTGWALAARLNKTAHLGQDLQYLGVSIEDVPLCLQLPPLQTQADVLGCLYVLEGATLGGRIISQHTNATLGITPTTGGRFFEGYAGDTAKMWQALRQMLLHLAVDTHTENGMVASAVATFAGLRNWCDVSSPTNRYQPTCMTA
jgi:heme oxygenase (biliverdin-IX-beta and delta-forming)